MEEDNLGRSRGCGPDAALLWWTWMDRLNAVKALWPRKERSKEAMTWTSKEGSRDEQMQRKAPLGSLIYLKTRYTQESPIAVSIF